MRKHISLTSTLLLAAFAALSQAPYKIKSCKIEFAFSTPLQKGTKTLIFADSGKVEKLLVIINVDTSANSEIPKQVVGNRMIYHSLLIQTKDSVFTADLDEMTGTKRARFNLDISSFINEQKKIVHDTFLNRKCDIVDFQGYKIWYWKGLALKKEMIADQVKLSEYATSIDENYIIKEDEFTMPKNIKLR